MFRHPFVSASGVFAGIVLFFCGGIALHAQTLLVNFGSDAGSNAFGINGWNTLIKSTAVAYTADGPGGLVADASVDEYADYQGVRGTARTFSTSERIVVTWYNRSDEIIRFTSRISFTDADQPDGGVSDGRWYTMRGFENYRDTWTEVGPHETARTMFAIRGSGTHKTDSAYALVNINLAIEWGSSDYKQYLVCDRIELYDDADITPPAAPSGVQATDATDSKIRIVWEVPTDNVGVYDYLVYVNGEVEGYSRENSCVLVFLEPATDYKIGVTALDVMQNESARSWEVTVRTAPYQGANALVSPAAVDYLGALRLPEDFAWGGESIAYRVDGDGGSSGGGAADGFPGSLFVTNLNQPENGLVGEVTIPAPEIRLAGSVDDLPVASILQTPVNIRPQAINNWEYVDIWRTGLEYLQSEQRLYSAWSIHYTVTGEKHANISCTPAAALSSGPYSGPWYVGTADQPPIDAQQSDWLFAVPDAWASQHAAGRSLVVGRCRDGGLSGLGPTLYAFAAVGNSPPAAQTTLDFTTMLQYGPVEASDNYHFPDAIDGYKHSDDWRGACWLSAGTQSAVAIIGRKAHGDNWYGYTGEHMRHDWIIADVPYYAFDETDPDGKGWRAHRRSPMMVLFDPADLAAVAEGRMASYEPQPYGAVRLDEKLFFGAEHEIFSSTYDPVDRILYVTEFVREADGALVVHAFRINASPTGIVAEVPAASTDFRLSNAPNPFHSTTDITYRLPRPENISLQIFSILGQEVDRLVEGPRDAGEYHVRFDPGSHNLPPGLYFAVMRTETTVKTALLNYTK
ncbi:MAG: T9SS type A sorting domain-containing protein [Bacteroidetes bacterium]|nr:T9SS type A sorting domain-containing protein [Bacteroidota bacterium]